MAAKCFYCRQNTHPSPACPGRNNDKSGKLREKQIRELGYSPEDKFESGLQDKNLYHQGTWLAYFFRPSYLADIFMEESRKENPAFSLEEYSAPKLIEFNQLRKLGESKLDEGNPAEAAAILEVAAQKKPGDYRVLMFSGYAQAESDNPEHALQNFKSAQSAAPLPYYRSFAVLLQARVYQYSGDLAQAVELVKEAVSYEPHPQEAEFLLAVLYAAMNHPQEALAQLEAASRLDRDFMLAPVFEPDFDPVREQWLSQVKDCLLNSRRDADVSIQEAQKYIKEAEQQEIQVYDPTDFETAKAKYELATKKYETFSYYGYLDASRFASEAAKYLGQAEKTTVTRKEMAQEKLKEHIKMRFKAGLVGAFSAAGWGMIIGGFAGVIVVGFCGKEYNWAIVKYAIKGTLLGFLAVYIYNTWAITTKKDSFLRDFTKQFKRGRRTK